MKLLILQGSLNPKSKTAVMCQHALAHAQALKIDAEILDLRDYQMEFCDGRDTKDYNADVQKAYQKVDQADAILFGSPLYCYSISGPVKNFIDLTSHAMKHKIAGSLLNAGGPAGFMISADLMKILSYENHMLFVQPTAFAWSQDYNKEGEITNPKVIEKIEGVVEAMRDLAQRTS